MESTCKPGVGLSPSIEHFNESTCKPGAGLPHGIDNENFKREFIFQPTAALPHGIKIESSIHETNAEGIYKILVKNVSNRPIILPRDLTLGSIGFSFNVIGKIDVTDSFTPTPFESDVTDRPQKLDVDAQFEQPLNALLNDFDDLFASKDSQLGSTGVIKHNIDTQSYGPIRLRPYRATRG